ncbi:hypothetical protein [Hoeflea sp. TYP-13]|uniref:hypothetical protein n=1 Tax=Hoeflea sp. TYP-13 TaxID=3230023 RepID=UPI0034C5F9B5
MSVQESTRQSSIRFRSLQRDTVAVSACRTAVSGHLMRKTVPNVFSHAVIHGGMLIDSQRPSIIEAVFSS